MIDAVRQAQAEPPIDEALALSAAACMFRSLGDPARLSLIRQMLRGEHRVVDLTTHLGLAQSTVSEHLRCLASCGIAQSRPQGRASFWSLIAPDQVLAVLAAAEGLLATTGDAVVLCPSYGDVAARRPSTGAVTTPDKKFHQ